jgi:hypothetical protein
MSDDYPQPRNRKEALAAFNNWRGTGIDRMVDWHYFKTRTRDLASLRRLTEEPTEAQLAAAFGRYDINVKPGNTLKITVYSGIPFLHVRSGHVEVKFLSSWGNSITIHEGASAHVVVPYSDTKVTITNEGGEWTMDVPAKNRVYYPGKYPPLDLARG